MCSLQLYTVIHCSVYFTQRTCKTDYIIRIISSVKALVHAFVTSLIDYCNSVLASAPKKIADMLQPVQNAASRLVTGTQKYERGLSRLMHDDLQWLSVPERVQYKLAVTVHRSLRLRAPAYLADYCVPVSAVPGRHHLRSARRHQYCRFHVFSAAPSGLRLFLSPGPQFRVDCLMICVIQL